MLVKSRSASAERYPSDSDVNIDGGGSAKMSDARPAERVLATARGRAYATTPIEPRRSAKAPALPSAPRITTASLDFAIDVHPRQDPRSVRVRLPFDFEGRKNAIAVEIAVCRRAKAGPVGRL